MTDNKECCSAGEGKCCGKGCTFFYLILGGLAGLGFWEIFSNVIASYLIGETLKTSAIVHALFSRRFGIELSPVAALGIFYLRNVLLFPILYYLLTRYVKSFGRCYDGWIWGVITYLITFGIVLPLANLPPFMLVAPYYFTLLSLVCYAVNGFITALVFEKLNGCKCGGCA